MISVEFQIMQAIHSWLISHPVGFAVLLFVAAIPFSIYSEEIKQLLKLPPQKLNVWILRSRLSSAEDRLQRFQRLRSDVRYFIYVAARTVMLELTWLFCAILPFLVSIVDVRKQKDPTLFAGIATNLAVMGAVFYFIKSLEYVFLIRDASSDHAELKLNTLKRNVDRLRKKVEEKGSLQPPDEMGERRSVD